MDSKSGRVLFASSSTLYAINDLDTTFSSCTYGWDGLKHYAYSKACIAHIAARLAKSTRVKIYGNDSSERWIWNDLTCYIQHIIQAQFAQNYLLTRPYLTCHLYQTYLISSCWHLEKGVWHHCFYAWSGMWVIAVHFGQMAVSRRFPML